MSRRVWSAGLLLLWLAVPVSSARGADHADAPLLGPLGRNDARITDLYAFPNGDNLVLVLCTNPAIPPTVREYLFPEDLSLCFHIDHRSEVEFSDESDWVQFGGTIVEPDRIKPDVELKVTFDRDGQPQLRTRGISGKFKRQVSLFAGLRDDPFIRTPRIGRNVAAVVIELPAEAVIGREPTLLIWATAKVPGIPGPIVEHAGRALRSMFSQNGEDINQMRPRDHFRELGLVPDVMILDSLSAPGFPNGRLLTDDVVDLVVDMPGGTLPGEDPGFPTENDLPFLDDFPYLAAPHPPDAP